VATPVVYIYFVVLSLCVPISALFVISCVVYFSSVAVLKGHCALARVFSGSCSVKDWGGSDRQLCRAVVVDSSISHASTLEMLNYVSI